MSKILVTGALGFIGSHFCTAMALGKNDVIGVNRLSDMKSYQRIAKLSKESKHFRLVYADLAGDISGICEGVDVVVHFAAKTFVDHSILDPSPFIRSNIIGTYNLLEQARLYKVKRFIQVSTDEVYGAILKGYAKENAEMNPTNPYSATKAAADMLVNSYVHTYKLPAIIVRCENNYGRYQHPQKAIPVFIKNALENRSLPVYGDGKHRRMWLYVLDFCRAIEFVIRFGEVGQVYNVGAKVELENIQLARMILNILKKPQDLIKLQSDYDIRPGHDRRYSMDISKLERLGWRSKYDFKETLYDVVQWYKRNEWWLK